MTASDVQGAQEAGDALAERLFKATIEALELYHVYLGERLGLYQALRGAGTATPAELAEAAGIAERYAREWLEQQAVTGIVEVAEDPGGDGTRRYRLPAGHAEVLLDRDSLRYMAPLAGGVASVGSVLPAVMDAFRSGGGVPYEDYGAGVRGFISGINRPMFLHQLGSQWVPAMPEVHARLQADPPARVADVGCGTGWSCIGLALAYPRAVVHGLDLDEASVAEARHNAAAAGVADRVEFTVRDAAHPDLAGRYDLVCAFETIHDMADPVGALAAMRALRAEGGAVLVGDEKVAEAFTAPGDELERWNYAWSAVHCLPVGMIEPPGSPRRPGVPAGTGTVIRPSTLRRYAVEAGFTGLEVLPIENDFWRFYRLVG